VLRNSAWAPSFEQATIASTKPRWLRHSSATLSPSPIPSSLQAWASAFVRRWTSPKVSEPASSMIETSSGWRMADAV
jgi:hypothetical protein